MVNIDDNSRLFYNELSKNCNQEKLLKIARNGLILYDPLCRFDKMKYHRNAVEISIIAGAKFIIYNNKQYSKFKYLYFRDNSIDILYKNCPRPSKLRRIGFSSIRSHEDFLRLIIPNEFFIKKFIHDIDYYKNDDNDMNKKYKYGKKEIEILICVLIRENLKDLLEDLLKVLFKNYKFDRDYKFDKFFEYDNNFILKLLLLYYNKVSFSEKEFKLLLIKEKENKSNSLINFCICDNYVDDDCRIIGDITTTPLQIACYYAYINDYYDIIKLLMNYGANVNIKNDEGDTPLHMACRKNSIELVKLLFNYKVKVNVTNNNGETPLHFSCVYNRGFSFKNEVLKYLIKHGADVNKADKYGNIPLVYLCYLFHDYKHIPLFIENGVDINKSNKKGETPLFIATKNLRYDTANTLIKYGADVNKCDNEGNTPLFIIFKYRKGYDYGYIYNLLIAGSNVNVVNKHGEILFHILCQFCSENLIKLFIKYGADVNKKDSKGNTPLSLSRLNRNKGVVEYLINHGAK